MAGRSEVSVCFLASDEQCQTLDHSDIDTKPESFLSHNWRDCPLSCLCLQQLFRNNHSASSSSSEDLHFVEDAGRLESCITQLQAIVGDTVPREELVRVALAADYDANRALNFFFSS